MPRHWSVRVLRAFVALWFVLSVGEPSIVHFCPMHGGLLGELAGRSATAAMPGMPMAGADDGGRDAGHDGSADHGGHSGDRAAHHHCTCIDCCVGAGSSAPVAVDPARWTLAAASIVASAEPRPVVAPSRAQPPGTGPPLT